MPFSLATPLSTRKVLRLKTCVLCPMQRSWHLKAEKASQRGLPARRTLDSCCYYVTSVHEEAPSVSMLAGQRTQHTFSADLCESCHLSPVTDYLSILNLCIAFILLYKVTISKHFHMTCMLSL